MTYLQPESVTKEMVDDDFCFDLFNGEAIEQVKAERSLERSIMMKWRARVKNLKIQIAHLMHLSEKRIKMSNKNMKKN